MSDPFRFFVGIDLGSALHRVRVVDVAGQILGERSVAHCGADQSALFDWLVTFTEAAAPASIAIAAELPHGAVVEAFLERGFAVFSINPKQLDRFRDRYSMAGAKDDGRDALVLAQALRTDRYAFRQLALGDPRLLRLRELTGAEESLGQDLRRAANQLWQLLQRYFPGLLTLVPAADEAWLWDLLESAPLPEKAARLRPAALQRILRKHRIRRISAQQLAALLAQPALRLAPGASAAIAEQVLLLLPRLRLLHQQQAQLSRRVQQLIEELSGDENFSEHRDVQILRSVPGVGRVFAATVLGEAAGPLAQRDYRLLRALAGVAPVTRQSGKTKLVSLRRACHPRLRHAVYHSAAVYAQRDPHARQHYALLRARGHSHARAVRGIADRFLALIVALLSSGQLYDPSRRALPDPAGVASPGAGTPGGWSSCPPS